MTLHVVTRPRRAHRFDGDPALAAERYGAILKDWPRDILALAVAHSFDFRLGRRRMLRDRVAQVLPEWDAAASKLCEPFLRCLPFGLEENGQYRRAETMARRALAIDPPTTRAQFMSSPM